MASRPVRPVLWVLIFLGCACCYVAAGLIVNFWYIWSPGFPGVWWPLGLIVAGLLVAWLAFGEAGPSPPGPSRRLGALTILCLVLLLTGFQGLRYWYEYWH